MTKPYSSLLEALEKHSIPVPECGCWIWIGAATKNPNGTLSYGLMKFKGKMLLSHRASWIAHNGAIQNRLHVLHKCDTQLCVNPNHLFLGTHSDNMKDMHAKGRWEPLTVRTT